MRAGQANGVGGCGGERKRGRHMGAFVSDSLAPPAYRPLTALSQEHKGKAGHGCMGSRLLPAPAMPEAVEVLRLPRSHPLGATAADMGDDGDVAGWHRSGSKD